MDKQVDLLAVLQAHEPPLIAVIYSAIEAFLAHPGDKLVERRYRDLSGRCKDPGTSYKGLSGKEIALMLFIGAPSPAT